jgi:hypothetical protein
MRRKYTHEEVRARLEQLFEQVHDEVERSVARQATRDRA